MPSSTAAALQPPQIMRSRLAQLAKGYGRHRPLVQRLLGVSMVVYILSSTIGGLSGSGGRGGAKNRKVSTDKATKDGPSQAGNTGGTRSTRHQRVAVDAAFIARLKKLLRIVIPGWRSREALMLGLHTIFLVLRTMLSLYVADLDGRIVASLVRSDLAAFLLNLAKWLAISLPACTCNAMLEFLQSKLASAYRTRLTEHVLQSYLEDKKGEDGQIFYKMGNLDDRIKNADQMITVDIQRFSNQLAEIYSNIAKPVLDVILYNIQLSRNVGAEGLVVLTIFVQGSARLLKALTPSFGTYAAYEATLEGEYRFTHSRLIESAEEIAFYRGEDYEKNVIERGYFALVKHVNRVLRIRVWHGMLEEGIIKWLWGSFGLCICAIPVFIKLPGLQSISDLGGRTEGFVTNRRLLLSASDAFGRVMYSYKDMAELAGYTARVALLLDTMNEVKTGKYQKNLVSSSGTEDHEAVLQRRGTVEMSDDVRLEDVPIVSPNGDVLVKALSLHIRRGDSMVVQGPNGCGKSSLFRILGGLWPVYGGRVSKPPADQFAYIPQRPYLCAGTLRDQIIYPHDKQEMLAKGVTDEDLRQVLKLLEMDHLVDREGGWDVIQEWRDALSGGDQQRIAMARLFYHKPAYAILDESTAAVTLEVERAMYEEAAKLGITLLTVSHRPSLLQYHKYILEFDGQGGYVFMEIGSPEKRLALQDEKQTLEQRLASVPKLQARLDELKLVKQERERREQNASA